VLPFVGSAAPIAAFVATQGGGRTGPAPRREREGPKRSGGWWSPIVLLRDAKAARRRRKRIGRSHCRAGPLADPIALSEGRGRGPLRHHWEALSSDRM